MPKRSRLNRNGKAVRKGRLKAQKPFFAKPSLSEQEVMLLKRRLNDGKITTDDIYKHQPEDGWKLTPEQTKKGLDWLMNQWKTPRGIERKNNPFGYREEDVLKNFKEFRLTDFYDTATRYATESGIHFYVPVYDAFAKDGSGFQYYVSGGKISIIG